MPAGPPPGWQIGGSTNWGTIGGSSGSYSSRGLFNSGTPSNRPTVTGNVSNPLGAVSGNYSSRGLINNRMPNVASAASSPYKFQPTNGSPLAPYTTLDSFNQTANSFKQLLDQQNQSSWLDAQNKLAGLYGQGASQQISANFANKADLIDQNLADNLMKTMNAGANNDMAAYDRAHTAAQQLYDMQIAGNARDTGLSQQQLGLIATQLGISKKDVQDSLTASLHARDDSLRNIKDQFSGAGNYGSSGRLAEDQSQQVKYSDAVAHADTANQQAQHDYDLANAQLNKHIADIQADNTKSQQDKDKAIADIEGQRYQMQIDLWNKAMQNNAATQQRQLGEQQRDAQLKAFYAEINRQAAATKAQQALQQQQNQQAAFIQAVAARGAPIVPGKSLPLPFGLGQPQYTPQQQAFIDYVKQQQFIAAVQAQQAQAKASAAAHQGVLSRMR